MSDVVISPARKQLDLFFLIWWLSLALAVPTCCIGALVSSVFGLILIYKYWGLISKEKAVTTPEKAVGFLFIPFFNLYWAFVAVFGLGKAFCKETGEEDNLLKFSTLVWCISTPVSLFIFIFYLILLMLLTAAGAKQELVWAVSIMYQILSIILTVATLACYILSFVRFQKHARIILARRCADAQS